jgi:outer membrane lipoprotein-sorting protein
LKTVFVLLATIGSIACATPRPRSPEFRPARKAGFDEVLAAYEGYCARMQTFSGAGDLEVSDLRTGRSRKVGVRVVAARARRLYLKGTVLVVTALELVSDGHRFWLEVPSKRTVWTGPNGAGSEAEDNEHAPYYALRPSDVTFALLPEPLDAGDHEALIFEAGPDGFSIATTRMEAGRGLVRRRIWLDRETLRLRRARLYGANGDTVAEAVFGGWEGGLPREVTISRPLDGYVAAFELHKAEANVTVPDRLFDARIPEGFAVKEVGS